MRPIHVAHLDRARPVVVLTHEVVRPHLNVVTVAPITTTIRGLSTEVAVDRANGLQQPSVIRCDNVTTIASTDLGDRIGVLFESQEHALSQAIHAAFDLV